MLICYRLQLVDVLGAAQTADSHEAALKVLDFQSEESLDLNERYLWSLSFGSHPVPDIIKGTHTYQNQICSLKYYTSLIVSHNCLLSMIIWFNFLLILMYHVMLIKYCTSHLQIVFVADLMTEVNSGPIGDKLHETMLLTIAAMTNKLGKYNETAEAEVKYGFTTNTF